MPRQLLFPDLFQFAVVRMDACAMVEPLKDPIAMEAARALKCKKYLVYLVRVRLFSPAQHPYTHLDSINTNSPKIFRCHKASTVGSA